MFVVLLMMSCFIVMIHHRPGPLFDTGTSFRFYYPSFFFFLSYFAIFSLKLAFCFTESVSCVCIWVVGC